MCRRLKIKSKLKTIIGNNNVYFQPPENLKMNYPAIVYSLNDIDVKYSDNNPYIIKNGYQVIVINKDPDNDTIYKIVQELNGKLKTKYTTNNLNHDVFNIFY